MNIPKDGTILGSFWHFLRIGTRILAIVGIAVFLGLFSMVLFYTEHQRESILDQNERAMILLADGVSRGLQAVMLGGYADIAHTYADNLKEIPNILEFRIVRTSGQEAFLDNQTIVNVNRRLANEEFMPRENEQEVQIFDPQNKDFATVVQGGKKQLIYETTPNGEAVLTLLEPIVNHSPCYRCHGGKEPLRGILKLTTSLAMVETTIYNTRVEALAVLLAAIVLIMSLVFVLIRRSVVQPIVSMTKAMVQVAGGDLQQKVPIIRGDELGDMAESFNRMSQELLRSYSGLQTERDKLTTIILSAREGIIVTDREGDVVLVNPSAERLLGKNSARIHKEGFLNLIDDPDYMNAHLTHGSQNMPEMVVYNQRMLQIYASTIVATDGQRTGSAALLRDITEEKNLEAQLRTLSTTDGLTKLFNRRRFDEILHDEFSRAKRYGITLGLLMFDVDHFKRFNDEHGHDQGDRVLQSIGRVMKEVFRDVDFPCRYGGEEFCVVMPNTGIPGAQLAAERLRQAVADMVVDGLKVTISIGVATFPHSSKKGPDALLKLADQGLYEAKRGGRNRVHVAKSEAES